MKDNFVNLLHHGYSSWLKSVNNSSKPSPFPQFPLEVDGLSVSIGCSHDPGSCSPNIFAVLSGKISSKRFIVESKSARSILEGTLAFSVTHISSPCSIQVV
ncbi:predicted protein [Arabidopsis lyrata subsp. lyrata]|uniref:Predicted protein n=1 Tax=Arabidopsis lyrata subsp. lyrata TaxID=81972 RepID=D7KSC5_ARALL|nr:predicted protein [Arabidopsis lyrata subsp. lyrata]